MSNLVVYQNKDGLELHIDNTTGEVFASISATARMVDRNESTLRDFIGSRKWQLKTAKIHTPGGLQGVRLLDESQIIECFIKYKPEMLRKFAGCGLRVYLHGIAGYTYRVEPKRPTTMLELIAETQRLIEEENRRLREEVTVVNEKIETVSKKVDAIEDEMNYQDSFITVKAYCISHKIKRSTYDKVQDGRSLSKLVRDSGHEIHEVPDKQYGKVNAYPIELVDEYYRGLGLVS